MPINLLTQKEINDSCTCYVVSNRIYYVKKYIKSTEKNEILTQKNWEKLKLKTGIPIKKQIIPEINPMFRFYCDARKSSRNNWAQMSGRRANLLNTRY